MESVAAPEPAPAAKLTASRGRPRTTSTPVGKSNIVLALDDDLVAPLNEEMHARSKPGSSSSKREVINDALRQLLAPRLR